MPITTERGEYEFSKDEIELIKKQIDNLARAQATWDDGFKQNIYEGLLPTKDELELFLYRCQSKALNPLLDEVMFYKRQGSASTLVRIDGFRVLAARSKRYAPGRAFECYNAKGEPYYGAAPHMVVTYAWKLTEDGEWHEFSERAFFEEYAQKTRAGALNKMWQRMGRSQLAKCCEARLLRRGWPEHTSGLYIPEEMEQATNGSADAPLPAERVARDVATLKKGTINRGHGNEGMERRRAKRTEVPKTPKAPDPIEPAETTPLPQAPKTRKELDEQTRAARQKEQQAKRRHGPISFDCVQYAETNAKGEALKSKSGKLYVQIKVRMPAKMRIEADGPEVSGTDTFYCYHQHLFPVLKTAVDESVTLIFTRTASTKEPRIYQDIEDVTQVGSMPFKDGKPMPEGISNSDTVVPPTQDKAAADQDEFALR